jgi:hypothetical protein
MGNVARMGTGFLILACVVMSGCGRRGGPSQEERPSRRLGLPAPPAGTWWDVDSPDCESCDSASLISDSGTRLASYWHTESWLYECGNTNPVYRTRDRAIAAVLACGVQSTQQHQPATDDEHKRHVNHDL